MTIWISRRAVKRQDAEDLGCVFGSSSGSHAGTLFYPAWHFQIQIMFYACQPLGKWEMRHRDFCWYNFSVCICGCVCVCVLRTLVVLQAPELAEVVWPIWFWWLFPTLSSAFHGCHAGVQLTWYKFKAATFMFTSLRHKVYRKVFTHWHDRRWEEPN